MPLLKFSPTILKIKQGNSSLNKLLKGTQARLMFVHPLFPAVTTLLSVTE